MKIVYEKQVGALYIKFNEEPSVGSIEVAPDVVLDLDSEGRLVGVDMDQVSRHVDINTLTATGFPFGASAG